MIRVDIKDIQDKVKVERRFIRKIVKETLKKEKKSGEVSLVLAGNEYVKEMNLKYRSVNRETDVLAFPMDEEILGDIVISVEKVQEQAVSYRQSFEEEMARIIIHGVLHLLGYNDSNKHESKRMHARQEQILKEVL